MCELKMLTVTSDNMTVCIFLQWNNKGFHKYDYLKHIYVHPTGLIACLGLLLGGIAS